MVETVEKEKTFMKRFASYTVWNEEIAASIRGEYEKKFGIDLNNYIPHGDGIFTDNWKILISQSFKDFEPNLFFTEADISDLVNRFILGEIPKSYILNAINRYEFYEPDIWIGAGYTICYLESSNNKLKNQNITEILSHCDIKEYGDLLRDQTGFCYAFHHYMTTEKNIKIFDEILHTSDQISYNLIQDKNNHKTFVPKETKDSTRWDWLTILKAERDSFFSKIITEKEYKKRRQALEFKHNKGLITNSKYNDSIPMLCKIPKPEDYVLYWKLVNGEIVRRFLPVYNAIIECGQNPMATLIDLNEIYQIDSISWQIILIEIEKSFHPQELSILLDTDMTLPNFVADTPSKNKYLLEWLALSRKNAAEINSNRKLMIGAMLYLYMLSDSKNHEDYLEEIQQAMLESFDLLQTPDFWISGTVEAIKEYCKNCNICSNETTQNEQQHINKQCYCMEKVFSSYMETDKICNLEINTNDSLAITIMDEIQKRGSIKRKIRPQKSFDSLTNRYIFLQRFVLRLLK